MTAMTRVPIEQLAEHLHGTRPIAVEQHGKIVGEYHPKGYLRVSVSDYESLDWSNVKPESRAAVDQLQETLQKIYEETGLTEDELADLMNPLYEFPYDHFGGEPDDAPGD
jgi:hypothetical protein